MIAIPHALFGLGASVGGRAIAGLLVAAAVAFTARKARALNGGGALAAVTCGTVCAAAGWTWAATLIGYFVASTAVSRIGSRAKQERTASVVGKGGARDAAQVFANGGVYSVAALAWLLLGGSVWLWGALGALAASAADTWATEVGVLAGWRPRDLLRGTPVAHGMSGGVTLPGWLGAAAGSGVLAGIAIIVGFPGGASLAAIASGWLGAMADSLLGATVQQRRRCDLCEVDTELVVHTCGTPTRHAAGIRWLTNDVVNLLATMVGFLLSVALYLLTIGVAPSTGGQ